VNINTLLYWPYHFFPGYDHSGRGRGSSIRTNSGSSKLEDVHLEDTGGKEENI